MVAGGGKISCGHGLPNVRSAPAGMETQIAGAGGQFLAADGHAQAPTEHVEHLVTLLALRQWRSAGTREFVEGERAARLGRAGGAAQHIQLMREYARGTPEMRPSMH